MLRFTNQKTISTVKRLSYTNGKGSSSVVYTNLTGYLRPLSEEQAATNDMQWGIGFTLITEVNSPILTGDILTIDSDTYTVNGMAKHDRGFNAKYYKYLLTLKTK